LFWHHNFNPKCFFHRFLYHNRISKCCFLVLISQLNSRMFFFFVYHNRIHKCFYSFRRHTISIQPAFAHSDITFKFPKAFRLFRQSVSRLFCFNITIKLPNSFDNNNPD
jgi:hypothetical protein